jgi:hypothetical protein
VTSSTDSGAAYSKISNPSRIKEPSTCWLGQEDQRPINLEIADPQFKVRLKSLCCSAQTLQLISSAAPSSIAASRFLAISNSGSGNLIEIRSACSATCWGGFSTAVDPPRVTTWSTSPPTAHLSTSLKRIYSIRPSAAFSQRPFAFSTAVKVLLFIPPSHQLAANQSRVITNWAARTLTDPGALSLGCVLYQSISVIAHRADVTTTAVQHREFSLLLRL